MVIMDYLPVQIRCLIVHTRESNKGFEINDPKCEQGEILLIMALLYFQKTKPSDGKIWSCKQIWNEGILVKNAWNALLSSLMMELSAFNLRASKEEEVYCLHQ